MNILLVNDDGINATGINILKEKLKKYGNIYVVAPATEQSCKSHYINCFSGLNYKIIDDPNVKKSIMVEGSPADCVRFACVYFKFKFDLCISGINNGANIGSDILYSGTIGAASEAILQEIKTIALSTSRNNFTIVLNEIDQVLEKFIPFANTSYLLNINFPDKKFINSLGYKVTKMGNNVFTNEFTFENNVANPSGKIILDGHDVESDIYNYLNGYITITPLVVNKTDYDKINYLSKLFSL